MQRRFDTALERLMREAGTMPPFSSVTLLLAVSGGADSMCLANLALHSTTGIRIAIAHCNFHLRGEESDGDEALVSGWAAKNCVEIHTADFDTLSFASSKGISIEMAARELRYGWFSQLCRENGYVAVAVAHNANDNAETLLLNLVRGTGMNGLTGISTVSLSPFESEGFRAPVLRPLLGFTRKQIEGYVFTHNIDYHNDSTNAQSAYKRNSIRNEVFPLLEKINPSFIKTLNREMEYFSQAGNIVEGWCARMRDEVVRDIPGGEVRIGLALLMGTPNWKYLLYYILEPYGFSSSVLSSVEDLLSSERTFSGKRFESEEYVLTTQRDGMVVSPKSANKNDPDGILIRDAGEYSFADVRFMVEVFDRPADLVLRQPDGVLILDAERLAFPFVCRLWQRGDWFVPFGMKGRKKLSDFFADLKYSREQKAKAVILATSSGETSRIAAVLGKRIDETFRITQKTSSILRISLL